MNKEIRALEDTLIQVLNDSDVPHEAKRLIVQNLLTAETKLADSEILRELEKEKEDGKNLQQN